MLLLDTHVWVWWSNQEWERFPTALGTTLRHGTLPLAISAISLYEVSVLAHKGRLVLSLPLEEWLHRATVGSGVEVLPVDGATARRAGTLPPLHGDPGDRFIIATAQLRDLTLISKDGAIHAYPGLSVRWDS